MLKLLLEKYRRSFIVTQRVGGGASGGGWIDYFEFNAFFVIGCVIPTKFHRVFAK